ncbi:MAG: RES family NAD+ phosphorylase [Chlorobi bacterium]|nr:RES family NAD+ phosphorylase [Chlorobiota bacterium]
MSHITIWRITPRTYLDTAFSGIGAKEYGGRFNSRGHRVVYTAESIALALLELLVRIHDPESIVDYICIPATFDTKLIKTISLESLPKDWNRHPSSLVSKQIGNAWLQEKSSPVLRVPSVFVPLEHNYLLNPLHKDFKKISIGKAISVPFDKRLVK